MGKFVQKTIGVINQIEQDVVHAPEAVTTFIEQKITDPVISEAKTIVQYIDREVIKTVEVIKEVPVETIKYIEKEVIKFVDVPVHVIREIEKIIEVPVEKIREIEKQVVKTVHKIPYWMWMLSALELLTIMILIIKQQEKTKNERFTFQINGVKGTV